MKFLADVNIPQSVITALIEFGYDVLDIKKKNPALSDIQLIEIAKKENRIILTRDKAFLALVQFPKYQVAIICIRLSRQTPQYIQKYLFELLINQKEIVLTNSLTIIKEDSANSYPFEDFLNLSN